jgi:L-alanine-DL-glutamate epimerase-like enolase superfamily enzyme
MNDTVNNAGKIATVDAIPLRIPFRHTGDTAGGFPGQAWNTLDFCLVKVTTDTGIVGWGDAFAYHCLEPVTAVVEHMIRPNVVGQDAGDIGLLSHRLQQKFHLFGRHGHTTFALSGLDIALWDIAGKAAGMSLSTMLGGGRKTLPAYSSLFILRNVDAVVEDVRSSLAEGYEYIKLHEIASEEVGAARLAAGDDIPIMVDVNCPWTPEQARRKAVELDTFDLHWLEEPIFPPEDYHALARLRQETGVPIAAGENWCTSWAFAHACRAGAVDYAQPSVTKVGGITEFRKTAAICESHGVQVMAHSPYFGPGFLATLHLAATMPDPGLIERFYIRPEAMLYDGWLDPVGGRFRVPDGPGLGADPNPDVIKSFAVR